MWRSRSERGVRVSRRSRESRVEGSSVRARLRMPAVRTLRRLVLRQRPRSLPGCGGEGSAERQGIKVGFFGALTGPTATFAKSGKNGALLAVAEINARGRRARKAARPALRGRPRRGLRGGVGRLQAHHARPRRRPHRRERVLAHARRGADRPELQGPDGLALPRRTSRSRRKATTSSASASSIPYQGQALADVRAPGPEGADRGDPGRRPQRLLRRPRRGLPQGLRSRRRAESSTSSSTPRATATSRRS